MDKGKREMDKNKILEYLKLLPPPLVGGLCFLDKNTPFIKEECLSMIKNVVEICQPSNILEFGTHCGSSSLLFLALSNSNVVSIDLANGKGHIEMDYSYFDYFVPGQRGGINQIIQVFDKLFPGRFRFVKGDSTSPEVFAQIKDTKFSLHFIDGGHDFKTARADCETCVKLNIPYALVDDYDSSPDIREACKIPEFELVKEYKSCHNISNIGLALFKNKEIQ